MMNRSAITLAVLLAGLALPVPSAEMLVEAIHKAPREKPGLWPGNFGMRFAYSAILLSVGKTPPWAESLLREVAPSGDGPLISNLGGGYLAMDDLFLRVRLPAALGRAEEQKRIRDRMRAGLLQTRRSWLSAQDAVVKNPHNLLAALCMLALLQEALPEELPSQRPYRFEWDNLELYRCKNFAPAAKGPSHRTAKTGEEVSL